MKISTEKYLKPLKIEDRDAFEEETYCRLLKSIFNQSIPKMMQKIDLAQRLIESNQLTKQLKIVMMNFENNMQSWTIDFKEKQLTWLLQL